MKESCPLFCDAMLGPEGLPVVPGGARDNRQSKNQIQFGVIKYNKNRSTYPAIQSLILFQLCHGYSKHSLRLFQFLYYLSVYFSICRSHLSHFYIRKKQINIFSNIPIYCKHFLCYGLTCKAKVIECRIKMKKISPKQR